MPLPVDKKNFSKTTVFNQMPELAGIEVLRFLCAFAILIWHYQHFFFVGEWNNSQAVPIRPAEPAYWLLGPLYEHGSLAVEVFWAISGFIFYWRYAQPIFDRRVGFTEFAVRRFSRLYPLHFVTLIFVGLFQFLYFHSHSYYFIYQNNTAKVFLGQLIMLWYKTFGFNGPIWSIFVEVIVYGIFFCIVRTIRATPATAIAASGLGFALYLSGFSFFIFDSSVFECASLFFAGGLVQWLWKRLSNQSPVFVLIVCVGTPSVALLALRAVQFYFNTVDISFGVTVVLVALCSVLAFACLGEMRFGSIFKHIAFLGNATYSSYLLHFPIQLGIVTVIDMMGYSRDIFFSPIALAAYLGLVIGISLGVYHLFELPAQKWIRSRADRIGIGKMPRRLFFQDALDGASVAVAALRRSVTRLPRN